MKATCRTCGGWRSSACWALPCSWGQVFTRIPAARPLWGSSAHFPSSLSALRRAWEAPKALQGEAPEALVHRARPWWGRLWAASDSLPELFPTSSDQIHPAPSPPPAVWFACGEGPGSGWGWEPLSCPTLRESDPSARGVCLQLPVPAVGFLSVLTCLFWFPFESVTWSPLLSHRDGSVL